MSETKALTSAVPLFVLPADARGRSIHNGKHRILLLCTPSAPFRKTISRVRFLHRLHTGFHQTRLAVILTHQVLSRSSIVCFEIEAHYTDSRNEMQEEM